MLKAPNGSADLLSAPPTADSRVLPSGGDSGDLKGVMPSATESHLEPSSSDDNIGRDSADGGVTHPPINTSDDAWLDRDTAWIHLSERELIALCLRIVPETVREKAQQMRLDAMDERLRANAAKALDRKRYRRRRREISEAMTPKTRRSA